MGQSVEEALNSIVEEMKEMLASPVYDMTGHDAPPGRVREVLVGHGQGAEAERQKG